MALVSDISRPGEPPAPRQKALSATTESLIAFKKGIDAALRSLEESPASHAKISSQSIATHAYGQGFVEAQNLSAAYDTVHDQLKTLSKGLGDQLEALGIAADMAHRGYGAVDQEHAARLYAIQSSTQKAYAAYTGTTDASDPVTPATQPSEPVTTGQGGTGDTVGM